MFILVGSFRHLLMLLGCLLLVPGWLFAQDGYASMGMALAKQRARAQTLPHPDEVVVEEFMNYHRHQLPIPDAAQAVNLDLQIAREEASGETVFQVGISTTFLEGLTGAAPLNLALVVDRSGSMAQEQRLDRAKAAMYALLPQLRPHDRVSLIAFDDRVETLFSSQLVGNGIALRQAVDQLQPRGSTDLMGGIIKGYEAVLAHDQPDHTQRLLILTDAIANQGVTDPLAMAQASLSYQADWQVDCAMICVGSNFQHQLARTVTAHGHHTLHFIDDAEDLEKVFVTEVQSLLAPMGKDVRLELRLDGAEWHTVYDYTAPQATDRWDLTLNDINYGLTQVLVGTLRPTPSKTFRHAHLEVRLSYWAHHDQRRHALVQRVAIPSRPALMSDDLAKTYHIALMAQALKAAATDFQAQRPIAARQTLSEALATCDRRFPPDSHAALDGDLQRMADILRSYLHPLMELSTSDYGE
jgi:hypothetical protein